MKKYSVIISLFLFAFIVYWLFMKSKIDSLKITLKGEVISITKTKRSGDHLIEVKEQLKHIYIYYTFFDEKFDIQIGDSLFKNSFGELFIKSKTDSITRLANDQKLLISE